MSLMLNIISIYNLLNLLNLLNIIPISLSTKSSLKFAFINGHNLVRCSDEEIRFRTGGTVDADGYKQFITCGNTYAFDDDFYAGLQWENFEVICTSDSDQERANEKLTIKKWSIEGVNSVDFSAIAERIDDSESPYLLSITSNSDEFILNSDELSIDEENKKLEKEKIYLTFQKQPIICRIQFSTLSDDLCENSLEISQYACYYHLSSGKTPSIELMEAEYQELEKVELKDWSGKNGIPIKKPSVTKEYLDDDWDDFDDNAASNSDPKSVDKSNSKSKSKSNNDSTGGGGGSKQKNSKNPSPVGVSTKPKSKSNAIVIAIIVTSIILLLAIVGGVAFFIIQKKKSNRSLAQTGIEKGDSVQSIENERKPNIQSQTINTNKRKQPGATMNFVDDG